jgi:hypothetical protein
MNVSESNCFDDLVQQYGFEKVGIEKMPKLRRRMEKEGLRK